MIQCNAILAIKQSQFAHYNFGTRCWTVVLRKPPTELFFILATTVDVVSLINVLTSFDKRKTSFNFCNNIIKSTFKKRDKSIMYVCTWSIMQYPLVYIKYTSFAINFEFHLSSEYYYFFKKVVLIQNFIIWF